MNLLNVLLILLLTTSTARAESKSSLEDRIFNIARGVLRSAIYDVRPDGTTTPDMDALVARITQRVLQQTTPARSDIDAELERLRMRRAERETLVNRILGNVAKAVEIVLALLVLRSLIQFVLGGAGKETSDGLQFSWLTKREDGAYAVAVSVSSTAEAESLGRSLVRSRLAASSSITGQIRTLRPAAEASDEVLLLLKTRWARLAKLCRTIRDQHPDSDISPLPILLGYRPHMKQIRKATRRWFG